MRVLIALAATASFGCATAGPALAARAWNDPISFSNPSRDALVSSRSESMALTSSLDTVLAWAEHSQSEYYENGNYVSVAVKPKGAAPSTTQILGGGRAANVAAAGANGAIVAWTGSDVPGPSAGGVYVAERQPDGSFGGAQLIASASKYPWQRPESRAAVGANTKGDAVVVFASGGSDPKLWSARRTSDGVWHSPRVVQADLDGYVGPLRVAVSDDGEALYSWVSSPTYDARHAWTAIETPTGSIGTPQQMEDAGHYGAASDLAMDRRGNAITTWVESQPGAGTGRVRAAVRGPGQPFGAPVDVGGWATNEGGVAVGLSENGRALIAWNEDPQTATYPIGSDGINAVAATVPAGSFGAREFVTREDFLPDGPHALAVGPDGDAAIFFADHFTHEERVVRRSASGAYDERRPMLPCPAIDATPLAAHLDGAGDASLLWIEQNRMKAADVLYLSEDQRSDVASPAACPPPPPILDWSPKPAVTGQPVVLDASGAKDPAATQARYRWDFDDDGIFELDTGEDSHATHTFSQPGDNKVNFEVTQRSQRGFWSTRPTISYYVCVWANSTGWGGPACTAQGTWKPPDFTMPPPPPTGGLTRLAPPPRSPPSSTAPTSGFALVAPSRLSLAALTRRGVGVSVRSARTGQVRLQLVAAGGKATRGTRALGSPKTLAVRAGSTRAVTLAVNRRGDRFLRGHRSAAVMVRAQMVGGGTPVLHRLSIRR